MSYRDAEPLLRSLGGPEAPKQWQGALGFTYHVGGGASATVHVKVDMDSATRSIYVVEGRIRGTEEPDKYVLLGNHRDAWVFGGGGSVIGDGHAARARARAWHDGEGRQASKALDRVRGLGRRGVAPDRAAPSGARTSPTT